MGTRQVSVEGKVVGFDCDSNCCSFYINLSAGTDRISMTRKIRSDHRHTCRAMQPIDFIHYKTKMSVEKMTKKWVHASSDGLTIRWRINGNPTKLPDDIVPLASSQRVTSTERTRTKTESGQKKKQTTRRSRGATKKNTQVEGGSSGERNEYEWRRKRLWKEKKDWVTTVSTGEDGGVFSSCFVFCLSFWGRGRGSVAVTSNAR